MGSNPGQILRHLGEGEKQGEGEVRCHYRWPQTEWLAESCQCHSPQHKLQKVLSWHNQFPKTQLPPAPIHGAHCPTNTFEVTRLHRWTKEMEGTCATSGPPESPWQASMPSSPAQIMLAESAVESIIGYKVKKENLIHFVHSDE